MPLSINVGLSRRASLDYQSTGVSINVTANVVVSISGLTLTGGLSTSGGGIYNSSGNLTLTGMAITSNYAASGGGVDSAGGAVIIVNSTIYNNNATGTGSGGGVAVTGETAVIDQSTLSANNAGNGSGGGIYSTTTGSLKIIQSTIALNKANQGGGIYAQNALPALSNTLVAQNQANVAGADVSGNFATTSSYNLIGVVDASATGFTDAHSHTGTAAAPLDPLLGLLASNGGIMQTHSLLTGSPVIAAGNVSLAVDA